MESLVPIGKYTETVDFYNFLSMQIFHKENHSNILYVSLYSNI